MEFLELQARLQYRLLKHDGFYSRVRCQNMQTNKGNEELIYGEEEFIKWARKWNCKGNLFVGRNPRDKEGNVVCAGSVTLDIDPVRLKAQASSEDQHSEAVAVGRRICEKYTGGNLCTSGNGALLIYPLEQPVHESLDDFEARCKQFEQSVRAEFQTDSVKVDSTYDLARLVKILGSLSTKGTRDLWRHARFLHSPTFRVGQAGVAGVLRQFNPSTESSTRLVLQSAADIAPVRGIREYEPGARINEYPSRSEADVALAHRLKLEGFKPDDTLKALRSVGFRPDRLDDHERIVNKLYNEGPAVVSGTESGGSLGSGENTLWTPADGLDAVRDLRPVATISTGFKWLDAKLRGGYQPGSVFTIEAVTNAGKSTFAIQTALNVCRAGKRVLYVTTEANREEFCLRYRAIGSGISTSKLGSQSLTDNERQALERFDGEFKSHPIGLYYSVSPQKAVIEKFIQEFNPAIILWDYFQHYDTGVEGRTTVLADLARWYQGTALQYNIPFVVAAQLHSVMGDYKKGERRTASMYDVKDSKVINDISRTVLVMDWGRNQDVEGDAPVRVTWDLAKNKGPMGLTNVLLNRAIPMFEEI